MYKLKGCPICSAEVKLMFLNQNTYEDSVWDESVGNVPTWFKCYGCDSEFFHDEPIDIPEKQIEWWNTRKPMERISERLEEERALLKEERKEAIEYNDEQIIFAINNQIRAFDYSLRVIREEGVMNE